VRSGCCVCAHSLIFFVVDMVFKIIAYFPKEYIADGWNKFDFIVVNLSVAGLVFQMGGAQAIRAMRAIRIVVVLKGAKGIRSLLQTLFEHKQSTVPRFLGYS
jgi:hypothetical protein